MILKLQNLQGNTFQKGNKSDSATSTRVLTLYSINTHFDASTTDNFCKHCEKKKKKEIARNCS